MSRPRVLIREENSTKYEPIEEVTIDLDEEFSSSVINSMNKESRNDRNEISNSAKTRIISRPHQED